eukprot:186488_1
MHFSHQDEKKEDNYLSTSLSTDREVITVGVGACGNRMSSGFWRNILDEHNLDFDGTIIEGNDDYFVDNQRIGTYFREMKDIKNKYVPRNIICDLDVTTIDSVRASNLGSLFSADSYIYAGNSANNLYSLGYNSCIIDDIFEEIRSEVEKCSSIQGFHLLHSVGGGTGSGLTSYLSQLLKDEYYDRIISSYTVYPSQLASDIVIEPYNMILSMPSLLSYHDMNSCIDNQTLFDISSRLFKNDRPTFCDLNEYICNIISSSTAGLRFKGSLNMDLRKLAVNILPFPRLKFLSISDAPLMYNHARKYTKISIGALITELFHSHQFLSNIDQNQILYSKYLAASIIFRGQQKNIFNILLNEFELEYGLKRIFEEIYLKTNGYHMLHSTLIYQPSQSYPLTATLFANNTAISQLFKKNLTRFMKFYKKKAYIQYYTNNGTLQEDFEEAISEIKDLLQEYNDKDDSLHIQSNKNKNDSYNLNHSNRKKLQKNSQFFEFSNKKKKKKHKRKFKPKKSGKIFKKKNGKIIQKNKKVYIKPVVIMSNKRRQLLNDKNNNNSNSDSNSDSDSDSDNDSDNDFEEVSSSDSELDIDNSNDSDSDNYNYKIVIEQV